MSCQKALAGPMRPEVLVVVVGEAERPMKRRSVIKAQRFSHSRGSSSLNSKGARQGLLALMGAFLAGLFSLPGLMAGTICVNALDPDCYSSIQAGVDAAASGDIVAVAPGTYIEQVTLKSGITLQGANRDNTIIWNNNNTIVAEGIKDVRIQDFTITSAEKNGIYTHNSEIVIEDNIIKDCLEGSGIWVYAEGTTLGSEIQNNLIENNKIGIGFRTHYSNAAIYGHIWNNVILNSTEDGVVFLTDSQYCNPYIANNVIFKSQRHGISVTGRRGRRSSPYIVNNIIMSNSSYGIFNEEMTPTVAFNDVYDNAAGGYSGVTVGPGSISEDPLFVNPAAGDFHLLAGSPCIDVGSSGNAPPVDIDGDARPRGEGFDIGVDEVTEQLPPPPCRVSDVPGDVNGDGKPDIADAVYLLNYLFTGGPPPACCPSVAGMK